MERSWKGKPRHFKAAWVERNMRACGMFGASGKDGCFPSQNSIVWRRLRQLDVLWFDFRLSKCPHYLQIESSLEENITITLCTISLEWTGINAFWHVWHYVNIEEQAASGLSFAKSMKALDESTWPRQCNRQSLKVNACQISSHEGINHSVSGLKWIFIYGAVRFCQDILLTWTCLQKL